MVYEIRMIEDENANDNMNWAAQLVAHPGCIVQAKTAGLAVERLLKLLPKYLEVVGGDVGAGSP
jgi:hypothetical protein